MEYAIGFGVCFLLVIALIARFFWVFYVKPELDDDQE